MTDPPTAGWGPTASTDRGRRPHPVALGIRLLGLAAVLSFLAAAFTPLANALNGWMAGPARLEPAEAIVVIGRGGVDADGVLTNHSLRRTLHGIDLHRDGLAPLLVFSGGSDEIAARTDLARGLGIPADRVLAAPPANTSREEAAALGRFLGPRGIRRVLLVADPVDVPRAQQLLERAGFEVLPAPTAHSGSDDPESRLWLLRHITTELAAWLYNRLAGR